MEFKTWIEIDGKNLVRNYMSVKKLVGPKTAVMAVVKANAYGHGLEETVSLLAPAQGMFFGVDSLAEAFSIKKIAPKIPTMILGYIPDADFELAMKSGFHISIYSPDLLKKAGRFSKKNNGQGRFHLKIETGTNRLGISINDLRKFGSLPKIEGVYTHFAETENPASKFYLVQLKVFDETLQLIKKRQNFVPFVHTAATSGLLQFPSTRRSMARLGIGLYGLWPSEEVKDKMSSRIRFRPVLSWKTRIAQIKLIGEGGTIGYDRTYKAKRKMEIAILPVGYYDGYDRKLSNAGKVIIRGKEAPLRGKVCMNMIMADVTGIGARAGDEAILVGPGFLADQMANTIGTINYEIVSRINPLLPRVIM